MRLPHQNSPRTHIPSWLENVIAYARSHFAESRHSHNWDHTLRVYRLCEYIGALEGADLNVLRPAAYLHDIGRKYQDNDAENKQNRICHAHKGADLAEPLIVNLPLTEERKNNILHCIRSHRYRNSPTPVTLEARVLFDADKLDAIGAIGIARAYLFAGEIGAKLHNTDIDVENTEPYSVEDTGYREYKVKLCKIKNRMLTQSGRKLAFERHAFMTDFFRRFLWEFEGKA